MLVLVFNLRIRFLVVFRWVCFEIYFEIFRLEFLRNYIRKKNGMENVKYVFVWIMKYKLCIYVCVCVKGVF